ncbi:MAG: RHS repeat protein, partial [Anaerolineaceae bacterium]
LIKEAYNGTTYTYTYDGADNLLRTDVNGVLKSSVVYDNLGRAITLTDGLGNTTHQKWNALGQISQINTPGDETIASNQTIYQYDVLGNLTYSKDTLGTITTFTYDSLGRNLSKSITNGTDTVTTSQTYDLNGNILTRTDGNGNVTNSTYDGLNRILSETNPLGQTTSYTYDGNGNQLTQTNYLGNTVRKVYDGINRMVEIRDALNNIIQQFHYNNADAQINAFDALHNEIIFEYDKNLRKVAIIDAEGHVNRDTYDTRGNIITNSDGNGNNINFYYDSENRIIGVMDALGYKNTYTYDVNGNLLSQTDGNGNTTNYQYNAANKLIRRIDPYGFQDIKKQESYTYYADGLMASKTDRNGICTTYTYDVLGNIIAVNAGGENLSYTYDSNNNVLSMSDSTGTTTKTYDGLNRICSKEVPSIGKTIYEYDLPTSVEGEYKERDTDPKGNVVERAYDKVRRLKTVTIGEESTEYSYAPNGNRSSILYPDGISETYTYNRNSQVIALYNKKADGTVISSYRYTYDAAGNQISKIEEKGTTTYSYDNLNRLSSVKEPEGRLTDYTYDGAGNRKTEQITFDNLVSTTLYSYDKQNRLTTTLSTGGEETRYLYDSNGNLISKLVGELDLAKGINGSEVSGSSLPNFGLIIKRDSSTGTGTKLITTYQYNNFNQLIQLQNENTSNTYLYNGEGNRVEKQVNGKITRYLYDDEDHVILETDDKNNQKAMQVYGNILLYREVYGDVAQKYYYLYNAHGDVTSLIDSKGNIAVTYDYDAFGNVLGKTGDADNFITYNGYQYDDETGLYYLNARYYDSTIARFITEDTYSGEKNDPLSLNRYTYCLNNPLVYEDPTGHFSLKKFASTALKVIAIVAVTAVVATAVVASAGTLGAAVATAAVYYGAGAAASTLATAAVVGTYAVAGGVAITGANRAVEAATGKNYVADTVFKGNVGAYNKAEAAISMAAITTVSLASVYRGSESSSKKSKEPSASKETKTSTKTTTSTTTNSNKTTTSTKTATTNKTTTTNKTASITPKSTASTNTSEKPTNTITPSKNIIKGPTVTSVKNVSIQNKETSIGINTPYGKAIQSNSKEALQLRQTVDNGGQLYRTGTFGKSNVTNAQFWAPENPLSSGYANKYGLANSQIDYVIGGTKITGAPYITRPAPPVPPNLGGGIEIVTNPNSVRLNFFHMPE